MQLADEALIIYSKSKKGEWKNFMKCNGSNT